MKALQAANGREMSQAARVGEVRKEAEIPASQVLAVRQKAAQHLTAMSDATPALRAARVTLQDIIRQLDAVLGVA